MATDVIEPDGAVARSVRVADEMAVTSEKKKQKKSLRRPENDV